MSEYYNPTSKQTASISRVRALFPHVSIPDGANLDDLDWRLVEPTTRPAAMPGYTVKRDGVQWAGNRYVMAWQQVAIGLDIIKANKLRALQDDYQALIDAGYTDATEAVTIDIAPDNINDWVAAERLIDNAGLQSIDIRTKDNTSHTLTAAAYKAMLARAGVYVDGLRRRLWAAKDAVEAATDYDGTQAVTL